MDEGTQLSSSGSCAMVLISSTIFSNSSSVASSGMKPKNLFVTFGLEGAVRSSGGNSCGPVSGGKVVRVEGD